MILYGAIDAGGTAFKCAVFEGRRPVREASIPTADPAGTVAGVVRFFAGGPVIAGLGVASFGPIDTDPASPSFGAILTTPKPGWSGFALREALAAGIAAPITLDLDVNAAALAEQLWGAGQGLARVGYITVGAGVGLGLATRGGAAQGRLHPEAGHLIVPRHPADESFPGVCPFHGACIEGMASALAIRARTGADPKDLPVDHPVWAMAGHYLAHLAHAAVLVAAADRVILGGGVAGQARLIGEVRRAAGALFAGYDAPVSRRGGIEALIAPAGLGAKAGLMGALALALAAA